MRTVAVVLVLVQHYLTPIAPAISRTLPLGDSGVRCFFVLSGFLITRILLGSRTRIDAGSVSTKRSILNFYARRALRILPLFYAVLLASTYLDIPRAREEFVWHASYLSNFFLAARGFWETTALGHFWTLAVEEQFYLFWPCLMLLLPTRLISPTMILLILIAPASRLTALHIGMDGIGALRLTPSCFDSLALGGLLAWCRVPGLSPPWARTRLVQV